jgi:hypothetical protein
MGVSILAVGVFYLAVANGLRIVKTAREQSMASLLLEQRLELFRTQPAWTAVISTGGLKGILATELPGAAALPAAVERFTISTYPGDAEAFSGVRNAAGAVSASGTSLPLSQTSIRVTGTVSWGTASRDRRTRTISTVLTKGGL